MSLLDRLFGALVPAAALTIGPDRPTAATPPPKPTPPSEPLPPPPRWDGTWSERPAVDLADEIEAAHAEQMAQVGKFLPDDDPDPDRMVVPWTTPEAG